MHNEDEWQYCIHEIVAVESFDDGSLLRISGAAAHNQDCNKEAQNLHFGHQI